MINMDSHNGLRGAAAIWVMIHHIVWKSKFSLDFQASSIMPLFFLLSGFSLSVCYGLIDESRNRAKGSIGNTDPENPRSWFIDTWRFYRNRFARVMPVYYFGVCLALPLSFLGFGDSSQTDYSAVISSILVSYIPVSPLLCFVFGGVLDGPGWTVCSLIFMWAFFPFFMREAKSLSDEKLANRILQCFWIQLTALHIIFWVLIYITGYWISFCAATMNPISRFPIFLMGVYAGELCNRHPEDRLPWLKSFFIFPYSTNTVYPADAGYVNTMRKDENDTNSEDKQHWKNNVTINSIKLLALTLIVILLDILDRVIWGGEGILGAVWFQSILPFTQLEVIVGLTRDGGTSLASKVLRTPLGNWLGNISMSIYLVHYPLISYMLLIVHGKALHWPTQFDCSSYSTDSSDYLDCKAAITQFYDDREIPLWSMPVVAVASMLLAVAVYYLIEIPARQCLRA